MRPLIGCKSDAKQNKCNGMVSLENLGLFYTYFWANFSVMVYAWNVSTYFNGIFTSSVPLCSVSFFIFQILFIFLLYFLAAFPFVVEIFILCTFLPYFKSVFCSLFSYCGRLQRRILFREPGRAAWGHSDGADCKIWTNNNAGTGGSGKVSEWKFRRMV